MEVDATSSELSACKVPPSTELGHARSEGVAKSRQDRLADVASTLFLEVYDEARHYYIASQWWKHAYGQVISPLLLSSTGIVIADESGPVAMTWLYASNSKLAKLGWTVADPKAGPKKKLMALIFAMQEAESIAAKNGAVGLEVNSNNSTLSRIMEGAGYVELENDKLFIKDIGPRQEDKA